MKNFEHYKRGYYMPPVQSTDWVNKEYIDKAPAWCSVDLRDGNQALIIPMSLDEKLEFFKELVRVGFKEIEVGFPAASETEYKFCRTLIEENLIPDDVTIQVLTQAREHIIKKTFEAIQGAKNVVVHLYNSTSYAQRTQVFKKSKEEILKIATDGAKLLNDMADQYGVNHQFEYSPESFTGTEVDYALEVCNAVIDIWKPTPERKVIINLPATVEMSLPHVYASQIEYMSKNLHDRENVVLSLHPHTKVQLGSKLTKGRGAGADPEIGQRAAEESKDEIANALKGSQMVFITAGMGGGTGTGAAPVVAEVAHDLGILTVGIVTKPFSFEGKRKMGLAEQGIANLLMHVDSLIVIPNERLKMISQEKITLMNAFQAADNVLRQGVESISALINVPAFINLDFADVRSIMKDAGYAHMGVGSAKGAGKAENAAKAAISSPLLETSIAGAHGVIINITSSPDIGLEDVETAAGLITQSAHPDANIIWGTAFDENLSDEMRVTVVATGFDNKAADGLRSSLNNAAGAGASTPSAVFSSDVSGAGAAKQQPAAAANSAAKPVEEESSDNRYYDELLAILNKRK